ncbi:MAG TPA: hypothetical protein VLT91_06065 [Rhizomicrobium sp.]|nr:hypothetical protein [Rhizomicrobium sp.]
MNIRTVAALLAADQELEDIVRQLKRRNDWRMASRVGNARGSLARLLALEQQGLRDAFAEYLQSADNNSGV